MHHFVKATDDGQPVVWQGTTYMPRDFEVEGFEMNGQGTLPRPIIRVSHINTAFIGLVREYDDLLGAVLTRWRTFTKYLDGAPQADPNAHFAPDVYKLDRKTSQNKIFIEWELAAAMDQEGKKLPVAKSCGTSVPISTASGTVRRSTTKRRRVPIPAGNCFDRTGTPCSASADKCGKRLSDCELRFPNQPLPTRAFPGVARTRS